MKLYFLNLHELCEQDSKYLFPPIHTYVHEKIENASLSIRIRQLEAQSNPSLVITKYGLNSQLCLMFDVYICIFSILIPIPFFFPTNICQLLRNG